MPYPPDAGSDDSMVNYDHAVWSVAWSPDGEELATGSRDAVKVWDAKTGEERTILTGHVGPVFSVASPDGVRLATGSADTTAKIWQVGQVDIAAHYELLNLGGHDDSVNAVAWSPDGKRLATASWDTTAKVWDADADTERGEEPSVQVHPTDIHSLMALARKRISAHPSEKGCKKYLQVEKCPPFPTVP